MRVHRTSARIKSEAELREIRHQKQVGILIDLVTQSLSYGEVDWSAETAAPSGQPAEDSARAAAADFLADWPEPVPVAPAAGHGLTPKAASKATPAVGKSADASTVAAPLEGKAAPALGRPATVPVPKPPKRALAHRDLRVYSPQGELLSEMER